MLRIAFRLHASRPRPTRCFHWTPRRFAQPDVLSSLDASPIVQAVSRRMQRREDLQSQLSETLNTPEDKERMKQISLLEPLRNAWEEWENTRNLLKETTTLLEDPDPSMRSLAGEEYTELVTKLSSMAEEKFPSLLVPPSQTSHLSAMLEIKAGVGGSEAALFVADMIRMYTAVAGQLGWKAVVTGKNETENGGFKDAVLEVKGEKAYDTLRWESGVHRVQRVPATEASGRVHTSTVAVLVLPLEEDNGQEVKDDLFTMDEIRIEVMRSRGAGGQHVNKTESAVRLTHIPTGITVSMQDERSQHQNRRKAFQVLRARLMDRKLSQETVDRRDLRRSLVKSADRSEKVRTYNYTQDRVTDHRLGRSIMNIDSVMDGDALQEFLVDLGRKHQEELLEEAALS
ncbi:peptide chain release factor 1 [Irpex lacteus]|nr:peptide chain release factor 1 [Irpex lacteus]